MATAQHPAAPQAAWRRSAAARRRRLLSFLWRKLHSLLGIIPIGAFFVEHIVSNFEALKGPAAYGAQVKFLNSLPLVRVLEWTFIFLPILYHGLYGVYIWLRGKVERRLLPLGRQLDVRRSALDRPDRHPLHRPACLTPALHGRQPS